MSKKVLVLSSSPRKNGNSSLLCDEFIKGALDAGNEAEKIYLIEKKINYCMGCGFCYNLGKSCPQNDDAADIVDKMIESDVIVLATPVYFYAMSAQIKILIDRCCSRYEEISNKEFYFIATAADGRKASLERTFEGLRGFTSCLAGAKEKGLIYGTGASNVGEIKGNWVMAQAYEMGKSV